LDSCNYSDIVSFKNDKSPIYIKIATLDYFSNHNREQLQSVINNLNSQEISPQLRDHIKFLTTPAQEIPPSKENSG